MSVFVLFMHISVRDFPNVKATARHLAAVNSTHEQQLLTYALGCVDPAFEYFTTKFDDNIQTRSVHISAISKSAF